MNDYCLTLKALAIACLLISQVNCGGDSATLARDPVDQTSPQHPSTSGQSPAPNVLRNAYFGDLHVHTNFSYDAFLNGTRATPDDAYRFARGDALRHPAGFDIQLDAPLDLSLIHI